MQDTLPNVDADLIDIPSLEQLSPRTPMRHKPRILLLYGSTRERSFSRLVTQEAARLLNEFGAETKIFDPSGLPLPDDAPDTHPKVAELRELMQWSGRPSMVFPRASWLHECSFQGPDRLGSAGDWRCTSYPRKDPCRDAGLRRFAII